MPHLSKHKLDKKLSGKLFKQLLQILEHAKGRKHLSLIVSELFTPTEKVMFAKRLAIVLMLSDKIPQHRITEVLKVSPSTVAKFSLNIEIGKFDAVLTISKKEKLNLEKIVMTILTAGGYLPPKVGKRYWTKYRK